MRRVREAITITPWARGVRRYPRAGSRVRVEILRADLKEPRI